mgnify:CR=1 FL=1
MTLHRPALVDVDALLDELARHPAGQMGWLAALRESMQARGLHVPEAMVAMMAPWPGS